MTTVTTVSRAELERRRTEALRALDGGSGSGPSGRRLTAEELEAKEELDEIDFLLGA